jgi:hypothetical protein
MRTHGPRDAAGLVGAEESGVKRCRLRLQPMPLVIPECVAVAVEADALLVVRQRVTSFMSRAFAIVSSQASSDSTSVRT